MAWRIPRFTTLQLLLAAALCALLLGLTTASWRATSYAQVSAVKFSPGGKYLAAQYTTGAIQVWDFSGPQPRLVLRTMATHPWAYGYELNFADEETLIDFDHGWEGQKSKVFVRVISIRNGSIMRRIAFDHTEYSGLSTAAGNMVALLDERAGKVKCIGIGEGRSERTITVGPLIQQMTLTDDGHSLITTNDQDGVVVHDIPSGCKLCSQSAKGAFTAVLSTNRQWLAFACWSPLEQSSEVELVDLRTNRQLAIPNRGISEPMWLAFSTNGSKLGVGGSGHFHVFDTNSGARIGRVIFNNPQLSSLVPGSGWWLRGGDRAHLAMSPDASTIATFDGTQVVLWDTLTGKLKTRIKDYPRIFQTVLFTALFAGWSAAWGIVSRREQRRRVAEIAKREADPLDNANTRTLTSSAKATSATSGTSSAIGRTPIEIKLCWGLMIIGGLVAIAQPILLLMHSGPLQWPMMYVSLATGIAAISKGAGQQTAGLLWVAKAQLVNLIACDPINFVLGTIAFTLLSRPHVRQYLALTAIQRP